jgi:hypothetical protein
MGEQRAEGGGLRVESRDSRGWRAETAEIREQRAEQRAESREKSAESREQV